MKIGDKVICVDDSLCQCGCGEATIVKKDTVYVISGFVIAENGVLGIYLIGVESPVYSRHSGWSSAKFRLLDELKEQNANKQQQAQVA